MVELRVDEHPALALQAFIARWPQPLAEQPEPAWLPELRTLTAAAPISSDDAVRTAVRGMLRHHGYKPSGRGKPASEYLRSVAEAEPLPAINLAVDLGNVVSLHSGLPISVVDLDRLTAPLHVRVADDDASYVFNRADQEIRLRGLPCLHDAQGACANAIKDAQRSKTDEHTRAVLCLLWGVQGMPEHGRRASAWHRELCERSGATVESLTDPA